MLYRLSHQGNQDLNPGFSERKAHAVVLFVCFLLIDCPGSSLLFTDLLSSGSSCCWAQVLGHAGVRSCSSQTLGHRLSCCGTWASLLCSVWDPPRPGIEPMSLALASGFLTTGLPGNSKPMLLTTKLQPLKCSAGLGTHYNPGSSI